MENTTHPNDDGRELIDGGTGLPFNSSQRYSHFWWLENGYKNERINKYPPIGDQLDALWKGGDAAAEMLARVQAVKQQFPKPE
jgi:hypothetical protein